MLTHAETVVTKLKQRGWHIAFAESCTGGMIASHITSIPGCSSVFFGGCVTYTNEIKQKLLGVNAETLAAHTEISAETACEMAVGARERLGTDFAVATTGIAGPGGGTAEHPVGTVYIAVAAEQGVHARRLELGDIGRDAVRMEATAAVLSALILTLSSTHKEKT